MDKRKIRTRCAVREALLKLLKTKHLSEITVKELCQIAGINRKTFYLNYVNLNDLYQQLEQELAEDAFAEGDLENDQFKPFKVIYEHQTFYRDFLDLQLESYYIEQTVQKMFEGQKQFLIHRAAYDETIFRIQYLYHYHGVASVIHDWLDRGCPENPSEFSNILSRSFEK